MPSPQGERVAVSLGRPPGEGAVRTYKPKASEEHRTFAKRLRREQTALEARLWHELRANRLDGWKFKRQVPIGRYVADFACLSAYLIVEVDGPTHDTIEQRGKDGERDAVLRRLGFRVLRFGSEIALGTMIASIRDALPPPSPDPRASARATLPPLGGGQR